MAASPAAQSQEPALADVSNLRGFFAAAALKEAETRLTRLITLGFNNASYHCGGHRIWVCPDYLPIENVDRLATTMEQNGLKRDQLSLTQQRLFAGVEP